MKTVMSESEYRNTGWKMPYEDYVKCYCPDCKKKKIVYIEMHTEEYHGLTMVLAYVQIYRRCER